MEANSASAERTITILICCKWAIGTIVGTACKNLRNTPTEINADDEKKNNEPATKAWQWQFHHIKRKRISEIIYKWNC